MQRLVNTIAMTAALAAIFVSLARDYGVFIALKRATVSYLAIYFVSAVLLLVFRFGVQEEQEDPDSDGVEKPGEAGEVSKEASR